mmetsp:Transcript_24904/g.45721  ORF Transcript_24904/g.45721 Transcript_24904/m.45721 type:complete len:212 (-) Transcript_24904:1468-2103(-)
MEFINNSMYNFRYLVDKGHDLRLEDFSRCAEITNSSNCHDAFYPFSRNHGINDSSVGATHVVPNDVRASFAKSQRQERSQLDDGLLQYHCLHSLVALLLRAEYSVLNALQDLSALSNRHFASPSLFALLHLELFISHLHCNQRIIGNELNSLDHCLHGLENQGIGIAGESQGCHTQDHAHEKRDQDAKHGLLTRERPKIEVECKVEGSVLR